jgi:asparagine synthase (glutamine-hydrolysing)
MSVQFGRWNLDGKPIDPDYLEAVNSALSPYGPDGNGSHACKDIAILYHAFHTTKESHKEVQPHTCASGAVITWDGRLDNRGDLISEIRDSLGVDSTDLEIVAAAYKKFGSKCLGKLIGDWALSIWNPIEHSLLLAKDPIGTRHLYYTLEQTHIAWSTVLAPLVWFADTTLKISEEYVAGWLSMFPAAHLTPWRTIYAVCPSSFVFLKPGKHVVTKYWDFTSNSKIRYGSDAEYEEHFRNVLENAVRRRLRADGPVLAELSGGRDSSSIVCVADKIMASGNAETPRLDTISYFNDDEPNWNERPYFSKVEEKRGQTGWHINVCMHDPEEELSGRTAQESTRFFAPTPGPDPRSPRQFKLCIESQGNRVVLSGIGGDETMGGVPTPVPELQNLLAGGQFRSLARQLRIWSLEKRKPWFFLFWESARQFLPPTLCGVPKHLQTTSCLQASFARRQGKALGGYRSRTKFFGTLPSFQNSLVTLDALRRQLVCTPLPLEPPYEKRYPYLDRTLLEFMFAIPREQLVRPTQRRSLMRRSLVGVVPDEVLNRRGKAFVVKAPLLRISIEWAALLEMSEKLVSSALGFVDTERFINVLQSAKQGLEVPVIPLMRILSIERWLRNLRSAEVSQYRMHKPRFAGSSDASLGVERVEVPGRLQSAGVKP